MKKLAVLVILAVIALGFAYWNRSQQTISTAPTPVESVVVESTETEKSVDVATNGQYTVTGHAVVSFKTTN